MNRTVAIIGTHPETREEAPWNDPTVDRWVFNEAGSAPWVAGPIQAVFQMHAPEVYRSPANRSDPKHWDWLQEPHPFVIWMQAADPDVPASRRYPLEAICAELLPGLAFGDGAPVHYFTSSIAYALALALYHEYDRIDLYGVEMGSNTEYAYQRDGVAFWVGLAAGRGAEVVLHCAKPIFDQPLYGYEGNVRLDAAYFTADLPGLTAQAQAKQAEVEAARDRDAELLTAGAGEWPEARAAFLEAARALGRLDGIISEKARYAGKTETAIAETGAAVYSRNEFEARLASARERAEQARAHENIESGRLSALWRAWLAAPSPEGAAALYKSAELQVHLAYNAGWQAGECMANDVFMRDMDTQMRMAGGQKSADVINQSLTYQPA